MGRLAVGMVLALVPALGTAPAASAAPRPAYASTSPIDDISPALMPLGVSDKPVTVVAQMAGDPVALTDAKTKLSAGQKEQQRNTLKAQQTDAEQRVQAIGGTVLGDYQSAYNGIKVRIAGNNLVALAAIPNVIAVRPVGLVSPDNVRGVPLVHAPQVWGGSSHLHGEGVKIAVIDTGIDYTHADFGGPGTPAAYQAALATDTAPPDPILVGPNSPKVKGGIDLVGDSYNADPNDPKYQPVPHPDPNPLDCNGHGTHTSGTAAGFGVLSSGATFTGAYTADTISTQSWSVGPGVAPLADIYAIRVFGCAGSSDVVVDAIDWAVKNNMDVINMSLGSSFGSADTADAVASSNAAEDGVIVVASAGNSGPAPYVNGSPAASSGALSVAASDPMATFPGANVALSSGTSIQAIEANGVTVAGRTLPVKVVYSGTPHDADHIALGCSAAEFSAAGVTGALAVVKRGTCARVARAVYGQQAGAAAVLMVNNADSFPPFEGPIESNPDTTPPQPFHVTIPFLGTPVSMGAALVAADGGSAALSDVALTNPFYLAPASFTSGGPRSSDSALKPDVTAPGVSIASAGMGTGAGPAIMSGTSMAAPHTAGAAALVKQAHPRWEETQYWRAALVNTADPAQVTGYSARLAGTGLVQADNAVATQAVAFGDQGTATLNYGFAELGSDYAVSKASTIRNFATTAATFDVATERNAGSPHSVGLSQSVVTVPAGGEATVAVNLQVPAATAGASDTFHDVSGLIKLTPRAGANNGVTLRVPYYLVPQAISNIRASLDTGRLSRSGSAVATTTNQGGAIAGTADWYAWGLSGTRKEKLGADNLRAVGIQAFPGVIAFAVSSYNRWSNAAANEFDIFVDVNGDGVDDYAVVGVDVGAFTTRSASGVMASAVIDLRTRKASIHYFADAPTDSSTLVLPVDISQLCRAGSPCLSVSSPRLTYHAAAFDRVTGTSDATNGSASFNPFNPSISTGMFDTVPPDGSATETVTVNAAEWASTPTRGLMIVSHDNRSGPAEAQLIPVDLSGDSPGDSGGNSG